MRENPTYQAANIAAPIVEEHFERHLEEARKKGETQLAPKPDARAVAGIINATFWASFRPEEGRFPKDRKSTRLNSSHGYISYAVFCLNKQTIDDRRSSCIRR